MEIGVGNYCFRCMGPLEEPQGVCPRCGQDNRYRVNLPQQLPNAVFNGRYLIGRAMAQDSLSIRYAALDTATGRRVQVEEYYPVAYAARQAREGTAVAVPRAEDAKAYAQGMAAFLSAARGEALLSNNTAYSVTDWPDGQAGESTQGAAAGEAAAQEENQPEALKPGKIPRPKKADRPGGRKGILKWTLLGAAVLALAAAGFLAVKLEWVDLSPRIQLDFPNQKAEDVVRRATGTDSGTISRKRLDKVFQLDLKGCEFKDGDLTFLKEFTNLGSLDLSDNPALTDLSPLSSLTGLLSLTLNNDSGISSLAPLASLGGLNFFYASGCPISDLAPLKDCKGLYVLNLNNCHISDLSPLKGLTMLQEVQVMNNAVSDLTPLEGLSRLSDLYVGNNSIQALPAMGGMRRLLRLVIGNNQISDLSPLAACNSLIMLSANNNQISDLSPLTQQVKLREIYVGGNRICDLKPLAGLSSLCILTAEHNRIEDLKPIEGLTNLEMLYLTGNPIESYAPLAAMTRLTREKVDFDLSLRGN